MLSSPLEVQGSQFLTILVPGWSAVSFSISCIQGSAEVLLLPLAWGYQNEGHSASEYCMKPPADWTLQRFLVELLGRVSNPAQGMKMREKQGNLEDIMFIKIAIGLQQLSGASQIFHRHLHQQHAWHIRIHSTIWLEPAASIAILVSDLQKIHGGSVGW